MAKQRLCSFLFASMMTYTLATFDMNNHELQYVADHLTVTQCRQLAEALHMTHFLLDHPVTGEDEPDVPCLGLLQHWDQEEARNKSFLDLALRLRQIGRPELSSRISSIVYHEKAQNVKDAFLSDPYKELVHADSPLLDTPSTTTPAPTLQPGIYKKASTWSTWHTLAVISIIICLASTVAIAVNFWCPEKLPECKRTKKAWKDLQLEYDIELSLQNEFDLEKDINFIAQNDGIELNSKNGDVSDELETLVKNDEWR